MHICVRTTEGESKLTVDENKTVNDIIPEISKSIGQRDGGTKHLVITPTSNRAGAVAARQSTLKNLMFNASEV